MNNVKLKIEVTGNEEDVLSFVGLCAKMELLSLWGANRTIPVTIDGDGSANLMFDITAEVKNSGMTDLVESWKKINKDHFEKEVDGDKLETHYIGE